MSRFCTPECIAPTPAQAHCGSGCHRTFRSVSGFDQHRNNGKCVDPTTIGMVTNEKGVWSTPMPPEEKARLVALRDSHGE